MGARPFELTEKEAEVLRLVDRTRSTGEIASIVGRSVNTVEAQIKSARRRLGGLDRFRAADMLRRAETSQIEVNPRKVMSWKRDADDGGPVDDFREGGAAEGNLREPATSDPEPTMSHPPSPLPARNDDAAPYGTLMMIIAVTAAAIALLLLSAPQLARGAQVIAERLLAR